MAGKKNSNAALRVKRAGRIDPTCYISFSGDGEHYAVRLKKGLHLAGIRTLGAAADLQAGSRWVNALEDLLNRADALILVGTPAALRSEYVLQEVRFFLSRRGRVAPIIFTDIIERDAIPLILQETVWLQEKSSALSEGPSREALAHLVRNLYRIHSTTDQTPPRPARTRLPSEKRPLNEGKLILVGRGEVGKTSLVKRLVADQFHRDESTTQGIKITTWTLSSGTEKLRLNVWDFGGQEIMLLAAA
jgi:hypothetical protein